MDEEDQLMDLPDRSDALIRQHSSNKHIKTYTAGEDQGRLADLAKELGAEHARSIRRPVRKRRSMDDWEFTDYMHLLLDATTEEARMMAVFSTHADLLDQDVEFDPHASGLGGNLTSAVLGIVKGMVGPAILYLPHGIASAGFLIAIPIMILCTSMFLYSCTCLLDAWKIEHAKAESHSLTGSSQRKMLSYPELAYRAMGTTGEKIVKTGIMLMQSGVCLTYLIFVPQNLHTSMLYLCNIDISASCWLIVMILIQIPLSWIKDIRRLTPTNLLANVLILYGLAVCLFFALSSSLSGPGNPLQNLEDHVLDLSPLNSHWFLFIGTSVLLFEGSITLLVPLQESVDSPAERTKFKQVYQTTILSIISFYAVFGMACWMAFGDTVRTVLTTSLPSGVLATTVQLAYSLAVIFTFPLQNFPALEITLRTLLSHRPTTSSRNLVSSILVVGLSLVAVVTMDSLDKVVSLMGSLLGCPIAFVFPPIIHSNLDANISETRLLWNRIVSVMGVVAMVYSSFTTIITW